LVLGLDKSIICRPDARFRRAMTQMLRRLAFVLFRRRQDLHRAAAFSTAAMADLEAP